MTTGDTEANTGPTEAEQPEPPPPPHLRCLAEAELHVWDWARPPANTYLVCSSARSGSTWLCEELSWRGLSDPLEYLNPAYVRFFAWQWGCATLAQYRLMLWRTRTTAEGCFGMKILGMHFFDLIEEFFTPLVDGVLPPTSDQRRRLYIETIVPDCTYLWLRRRDKVRQAVSWWLADETEVWMQFAPEDRRQLHHIQFDFDAIDAKRRQCEWEDERWGEFFTHNDIEPLEAVYEDLQQNPAPGLADLASRLGSDPAAVIPTPDLRNHVQRNAATEEFVLRYQSERAGRP